jgi:tRNA threonylcarbamoyladenosine biosynthesis protein TsaB
MDARMGELYWGLFRDAGGPVGEAVGAERLSRPESVVVGVAGLVPAGTRLRGGAGMGLSAYPDLAMELGLAAASCLPDAEPHASAIARLAAADLANGAAWLDAAAAQPVYLRDQVVQTRPL